MMFFFSAIWMFLLALVMQYSFCRGLRDIRNFRSAVGVLFLA